MKRQIEIPVVSVVKNYSLLLSGFSVEGSPSHRKIFRTHYLQTCSLPTADITWAALVRSTVLNSACKSKTTSVHESHLFTNSDTQCCRLVFIVSCPP